MTVVALTVGQFFASASDDRSVKVWFKSERAASLVYGASGSSEDVENWREWCVRGSYGQPAARDELL